MATLHYQIKIDGLDDDSLVVRQFSGTESISSSQLALEAECTGYRYHIDLASRRNNLHQDDIVDKKVQLELYKNSVLQRVVHGIARQFVKGDTGHHHTFYSVVIVPELERLSLRHNSRIFQLQTVPEIVSILLQEMGMSEYAFSLKHHYVAREYCVQYRETDLEFIHRLLAEEGISYYFLHESGKHTVVFCDSAESLIAFESPVLYNPTTGGSEDSNYISSLVESKKSQVSRVTMGDYSFKKPTYRFLQQSQASDIEYQNTELYEHFDFPGRYKQDSIGLEFSRARLEYLRSMSHSALAKSNHLQMQVGSKFQLEDDLENFSTPHWQVINLYVSGTQPQALQEEGGEGATTYNNRLVLIPANVTWQAEPQCKPKVDGASVAIVVGPEAEEIYCDEHGRVKVHFPWDRYSNGDEQSSCWVRVSQGWAGSQYGMLALPRVGQEVIVSFLEGDPDQPIITGRTYNAANVAPYALPENKSKTVFRTESHQGSGFNELSFEDQAGIEQVYIHAQKDLETKVLNDAIKHIKHNQHVEIDNDQFQSVTNDHHSITQAESRISVKGTYSDITQGSAENKLGTLLVAQAGREISLNSGAKVVVEAGAEITLKAGGSFVKVDGGGVHLVGPTINLNAGGSAGSGSGYAGTAPALPNHVEAPEVPKVSKAVSYQALLKAEQASVPAVKPCPLSGD
ncbi:type VI secretion system tip protein VgrG [Vibrio sp. JPW-9-11-11]|uniref:type VI secretion system Vgr family protein n=1 Tax=Vibrio sp. JPW-9-11-11 TaxID=1416532 RepID=UPI001594B526|nr:type VI secretion system tip protein TssI/VgrG [Vibrio sp. JPW-9-11-11]NVD06784.1 type VI secretion system tip protein VgrG [Vibrio sp. JPW-9-11-11]